MNIADLYNVIMQNYMKLLIGRNKKAAVRGAKPNDDKAEEYAIPSASQYNRFVEESQDGKINCDP